MPRTLDPIAAAAEREDHRIYQARRRAVERVDLWTERVADLEREAASLPAYFPLFADLAKARARLAYFTAAAVRDGLMTHKPESCQ